MTSNPWYNEHRANCIIRNDEEDPDKKVVLIDYEFSCYNYRGADLGSHFKNREIDVTKMAGKMDENGFKSGIGYPSEEERRHFIRAYLAEVARIGKTPYDPLTDNEEAILIESEFFGLLYQVFFMAWIIRDREKFKHMDMGVNGHLMGLMLQAESLNAINDRRALVEQYLNNNWLTECVTLSNDFFWRHSNVRHI